jgi:hypothetical protein
MEVYNKKIRDMIENLDSKKHYDEPRMMFHESVHTPRKHILAGGNDFVGAGNILPGQNDLKGDVVGPVPKTKRTSKRGELVRTIMKEKGMTLPEASKFIKNNM